MHGKQVLINLKGYFFRIR